jgi:hypothetical protein
MRKNKTITESVELLEAANIQDNVIKNVKVLGIYSKNGRIYPLSTMRAALEKYEGCVVNLDHKPNEIRSVLDRFGQIKNVRLEEDGIRGDLQYNPAHPYAAAFKYFVETQPDALGLSHAALCKTKMERDGTETVQSIEEVESTDVVCVPATNRNIFESYTQILESVMKKKDASGGVELVSDMPHTTVESDKVPVHHMEALSDDKNLPHDSKLEALADDKDLPHKSRLEALKSKKYETLEAYNADLKEALEAVLGADIDVKEKIEAVMGLCKKTEMCDKEEKKESVASDVMGLDEADDKVKAEESLKKTNKTGYKMILEELESYRIKEAQQKALGKAKEFCVNSGLNEKLITEAFIDVLVSVNESKWEQLVTDRKSIASGTRAPISFSGDVASGHKTLTVDELVKKLRS